MLLHHVALTDTRSQFEAEDLKPPFRLKLPIKPKTDDSFVPRQVKKSAKVASSFAWLSLF